MRIAVIMAAAAAAFAGLAPLAASAATSGPGLQVVEKIPGPDGPWDYSSFDAARRRVYVSHGDVVLSLDVTTGKLDPDFAKGDRLHEIVPAPGTAYLVTTNSGDNTVRILKAADGSLVKSLPVAEDADGAVYDRFTHLVVVVNGDPGLLTLVDPARRKVAGVIKVGGKLEFAAVDGRGKAYVNVTSDGEVAVVDLVHRRVLQRFPMKGCVRPTGIAYVSDDRLVAACGGGGAVILSAADGHEIASFKLGKFPDAVIYDARRQLAYVPTAYDGKLNVIALSGKADDTLVAQVPTQIGARSGALDPATGRIYLPTATYNLPVPPGQRPTTKPGTFVILVVDRR